MPNQKQQPRLGSPPAAPGNGHEKRAAADLDGDVRADEHQAAGAERLRHRDRQHQGAEH
jgi:hypothetical protein